MSTSVNFVPHSISQETRPDGVILLNNNRKINPVVEKTGDWLLKWASKTPQNIFIAERSGSGWREESYGSMLQKVQAVAQSLAARGMNANTPIIVLSGNSVDHAIIALAAQYIGVPIVPVAEQYSLIKEAHPRLKYVIDLVKPKMAFVSNADQYADALAMDEIRNMEVIASEPGSQQVTPLSEFLKGDASIDLNTIYASVGPASIAKILMTSGSTSDPKGVVTTQQMLCANQSQLVIGLPFLNERPPVLMDWLPWNHTFGGSHNFNMMLANGGAYYIDDGKPMKGLFERSLENMKLKPATISLNVPVGFSMILNTMREDTEFRRSFFENLDMLFYAAASLPAEVWNGLEEMAMEVRGNLPLMTSCWGLTETAPACIMQTQLPSQSGMIGVPLPGVTAKLLPMDEGRYEVRVKGPNIMPGYFRNEEKTAESFDEEGFFITGDMMKFTNPEDRTIGLRYDGRIAEEFKLLTGTWVRAANIRAEALTCLAPLVQDVVITGSNRKDIGIFIFPAPDALQEAGLNTQNDNGILTSEDLTAEITKRLKEREQNSSGSSTKISRAIVLAEPPSVVDGEITAKGSLNVRKIQQRREPLLDRLYNDDPAVILL